MYTVIEKKKDFLKKILAELENFKASFSHGSWDKPHDYLLCVLRTVTQLLPISQVVTWVCSLCLGQSCYWMGEGSGAEISSCSMGPLFGKFRERCLYLIYCPNGVPFCNFSARRGCFSLI